MASTENYPSTAEINGQDLPTKEVETKNSINVRAGRQGMTEHGKIRALLSQRRDLTHRGAGNKLNAAPGGYLVTVRDQSPMALSLEKWFAPGSARILRAGLTDMAFSRALSDGRDNSLLEAGAPRASLYAIGTKAGS